MGPSSTSRCSLLLSSLLRRTQSFYAPHLRVCCTLAVILNLWTHTTLSFCWRIVSWSGITYWMAYLIDDELVSSSRNSLGSSLRVPFYWYVTTWVKFLQKFAWWLSPSSFWLTISWTNKFLQEFAWWLPLSPLLVKAWFFCCLLGWCASEFEIYIGKLRFGSETDCFSFLQWA